MIVAEKPRAGFYTGTFDPPTRAHLRIMTDAVRKQGLARLRVVVNQSGSGKVYRCSAEQRVALIRAGLPADVASRVDISIEPPQGKNALRAELEQHGNYHWLGIIGYDSYVSLSEAVRSSSHWLVVNRNGLKATGANVQSMDIGRLGQGISSSTARALLAVGRNADSLLARGTAQLIAQHHWYRAPLDEVLHQRETGFLSAWNLITGARAALAPPFVPQQSPEEYANYIHRYLEGALRT